jgi:hypothetical protein
MWHYSHFSFHKNVPLLISRKNNQSATKTPKLFTKYFKKIKNNKEKNSYLYLTMLSIWCII